ncbi:hypothetical protein [Azotobacter salinestris]|uniref:hypothetical protein n=1 Tax=Azotobacter salinestris TaxID=69964 RepID=UPI001266E4BF|nr:hypothetical protein [Azotobacter salinestris]
MTIQALLLLGIFAIDHLRPAFAALEMIRFRIMFFARMRQAIAKRPLHRYPAQVTVNPVTGLGRPNRSRRTSAHHSVAGAFFVPAMSLYGGLRGDTFGCAGSLGRRSANPAQSVAIPCLAASGDGSPVQGEPPMTQRHVLTLNPSKARAAAHRAMALAALRADSSLSVRLKRYNARMAKARALEAQEVLA